MKRVLPLAAAALVLLAAVHAYNLAGMHAARGYLAAGATGPARRAAGHILLLDPLVHGGPRGILALRTDITAAETRRLFCQFNQAAGDGTVDLAPIRGSRPAYPVPADAVVWAGTFDRLRACLDGGDLAGAARLNAALVPGAGEPLTVEQAGEILAFDADYRGRLAPIVTALDRAGPWLAAPQGPDDLRRALAAMAGLEDRLILRFSDFNPLHAFHGLAQAVLRELEARIINCLDGGEDDGASVAAYYRDECLPVIGALRMMANGSAR